jgi:serine/threonine-protein kinase
MIVRGLASAAVVAGVLASPLAATAQTNNKVAAEALFRDARRLLDAGNYKEACEKLAASERLDPAVGTLLNLAHCYEKLGRTASAWGTYREAITAAKLAGQADREKSARKSADALEPTLPHLTVTVSAEAKVSGMQVTRDGVAVVQEIWGTSVPVDPGEHVIAATAPGRKGWSTTINSAAGAAANVDVPPLERSEEEPAADGATPAAAVPSAKPPAAVPPATSDQAAPASRPFWNTQRTIAVVSGGIGIAGGVLAIVEFLNFNDKKDQVAATCDVVCMNEDEHKKAIDLRDQAATARTWAIVGTAVGGAGLIAGTILWFTAPSGGPEPGAVGLAAAPTPGGLTISLHGVL